MEVELKPEEILVALIIYFLQGGQKLSLPPWLPAHSYSNSRSKESRGSLLQGKGVASFTRGPSAWVLCQNSPVPDVQLSREEALIEKQYGPREMWWERDSPVGPVSPEVTQRPRALEEGRAESIKKEEAPSLMVDLYWILNLSSKCCRPGWRWWW